jgi:hypothetical protein
LLAIAPSLRFDGSSNLAKRRCAPGSVRRTQDKETPE